jgi:hypothetical protein
VVPWRELWGELAKQCKLRRHRHNTVSTQHVLQFTADVLSACPSLCTHLVTQAPVLPSLHHTSLSVGLEQRMPCLLVAVSKHLAGCCLLLCGCRLRQAVDHPYLVVYSATSNPTGPTADLLPGAHPNDDLYHTAPDPTAGGPTAAEAAAGYGRGGSSPAGGRRGAAAAGGLLVQGEDGCCGLCHDPVEDSVVAGCGHAFCRTCVAEYIESLQRVRRSRVWWFQVMQLLLLMLMHCMDPAHHSILPPVGRTYPGSPHHPPVSSYLHALVGFDHQCDSWCLG